MLALTAFLFFTEHLNPFNLLKMKDGQLRKNALRILIVIFGAAIVFHIFVMTGLVASSIVWGGRIESQTQFYVLESISLILNLTFLVFCLIAAGFIKAPISEKFLRRSFFVIGVIFLANTMGNILSLNDFERTVFTGLTFILSILSFIVAIR